MALMPSEVSLARVNAARVIAVAADCLQLMVFPAFVEGYLSPLDDIVDVIVAMVMFLLLGWHWAFVPSFLAKLVPALDLVPTWTAAVFFVTGFGPSPVSTSKPTVSGPTGPPRLPSPELPARKGGPDQNK